jgi:hypothetical protein
MKIYLLTFFALISSGFLVGQNTISSGPDNKGTGKKITFKLVNNKTLFNAKIENSRLLKIVLDSGMGWDGIVNCIILRMQT